MIIVNLVAPGDFIKQLINKLHIGFKFLLNFVLVTIFLSELIRFVRILIAFVYFFAFGTRFMRKFDVFFVRLLRWGIFVHLLRFFNLHSWVLEELHILQKMHVIVVIFSHFYLAGIPIIYALAHVLFEIIKRTDHCGLF